MSLKPFDAACLTRVHRTNTESRFSRVMKLFVRGSAVWLMCCSSQSTGASAALKIFFTASAISGPMPSPGNSVAVMRAWLLKSLQHTETYRAGTPLHSPKRQCSLSTCPHTRPSAEGICVHILLAAE